MIIKLNPFDELLSDAGTDVVNDADDHHNITIKAKSDIVEADPKVYISFINGDSGTQVSASGPNCL